MKKPGVALLIFACVLFTGCASLQDGVFDLAMEMERDMAGLALKSVRIGGRDYAYLEREGVGETVVLLHGFTANKDNWVRFVRYMPEIYRIIAIDMPGHGDNAPDLDATWSPHSLSRGVGRVMEELGLESFHIAGNSLGGLVAKLYALDNPKKVKTIGLFNSAGVESSTRSEFETLLENGDNLFDVDSRDDFDRLGEYVFHDPPFLPWPVRPVLAREYIPRSAFYMRMLDEMKGPAGAPLKPVTDQLKHLKMPALVLWGDKDRMLHVSGVEVYRRHLPDARIVIMKDCGHAPMIERPEESAGHYARFLEETPSLPRP
ncbi:MAG: alpha/beta fold hydrolase [Desulfobacterales bacterium]|nr:alpha/beta fold hydrolase [Desulfobacterales bacterium]